MARRWATTEAAVAAAAVLLAGCGGSGLRPVSGSVRYRGEPVKQGLVQFVPAAGPGLPVNAPIRPDGTFSLSGQPPYDGVSPGDYKVVIVSKSGKFLENPNAPETWYCPRRYGAVGTTPLTASVPPGQSPKFEFDLTD